MSEYNGTFDEYLAERRAAQTGTRSETDRPARIGGRINEEIADRQRRANATPAADPVRGRNVLDDFDHRSAKQKAADRASFERRSAEADAHHEQTKARLAESQRRLVDAMRRSGERSRYHDDRGPQQSGRGRER